MTDAHKTTTLARPPKAFGIDASWYQSYWYDRPQRELRKPGSRAVQIVLCIAVFLAGTYFASVS
jgi:hypothetical protein